MNSEFQEFLDLHCFELHECAQTQRKFNNGGIFYYKTLTIYSQFYGYKHDYESTKTALGTEIIYRTNVYDNKIFYIIYTINEITTSRTC